MKQPLLSSVLCALGCGPLTLLLVLGSSLAILGCDHSPLDSYDKKRAAYALDQLKDLERQEKRNTVRLKQLVALDKALLSEHRVVKKARARMRGFGAEIKKLQPVARELRALIKKDRQKDTAKVKRLSARITSVANKLDTKQILVLEPVNQILIAKRNAKKLLAQVTGDQAHAKTFPGDTVKRAVDSASAEYPELKAKLVARVAALSTAKLERGAAGFYRARKKTPPDYLAMGRLAKDVHQQRQQLDRARKRLLQQIAELGEPQDLILVDMKEKPGACLHRYKRIRGKKVELLDWKEVPCTAYKNHEDHIGMSVWSKPVGVLADDAERLATPPGYVYLDKPRYGKWLAGQGDSRKWKFHDKYAYMLPLFWGAGLGAVTYGMFRQFQMLRRQRKVFYGVGAPLYGSRSKRARLRYKKFFVRRAKLKAARVRSSTRTGSSRSGGYGRGTRRSGK